jgi:hypothetical protein
MAAVVELPITLQKDATRASWKRSRRRRMHIALGLIISAFIKSTELTQSLALNAKIMG